MHKGLQAVSYTVLAKLQGSDNLKHETQLRKRLDISLLNILLKTNNSNIIIYRLQGKLEIYTWN